MAACRQPIRTLNPLSSVAKKQRSSSPSRCAGVTAIGIIVTGDGVTVIGVGAVAGTIAAGVTGNAALE